MRQIGAVDRSGPILGNQGAANMRVKVFFALLSVILFSGGPAVAQQGPVTGAQMKWCGVYTAAQTTKEKDKSVSSGIVGPKVSSDRIPMVEGTRFGMGYRLAGRPETALVTIRHIRIRPNETTETQIEVTINRTDLFIGTIIDAELAAGDHTHQVWYKDRLLLEKRFALYRR